MINIVGADPAQSLWWPADVAGRGRGRLVLGRARGGDRSHGITSRTN